MTVDPGTLGRFVGGTALRESWREEAAVRALERAERAVVAALCRVVGAEDVDWLGGPAGRYRCQLEDVVDRTRAVRALLATAVRAADEHAHAVRLSGAVTWGGPPSIGDRWSPWPWGQVREQGAPGPHRGLVPGIGAP